MKTGDKVRVLKTMNKVPEGLTGTVHWVGISKYNKHGRIGIKTDDGAVHFIDSDNVEITDPAPF